MKFVRLSSKVRKFGRLDAADKWLFLRAVAWLAIARLMLAVYSFGRLAEKLAGEAAVENTEADAEYLQRVSYAVAAAANNVPWRSDCFPQSIAARMLLKRRGFGSTIHIGVERQGDDVLNGHAWLTCGNTVVTGGAELHRYLEMHRLDA